MATPITITRPSKTFDYNLIAQDGTAVGSSSVIGKIASAANILDLGAGLFEGELVFDVTVMSVGSSDEICTVGIQVSSSSTFASDIYTVAAKPVGHATPLATNMAGNDVNQVLGRYTLPFNNEIVNGETKRYMRVYFKIAGTTAGVTCYAYITKRR